MRLALRPLNVEPTAKPRPLPKAQTQQLVPRWVWGGFIISFIFFLATVYITSWTSTGPSFLPPELSSPFNTLRLNPFEYHPNPPGTRYLPEFLQLPGNVWEVLIPLGSVAIGIIVIRMLPANNWTRLVVKLAVVGLGLRYMTWRLWGGTMNLSTTLSIVFSVTLLAVELFGFVSMMLTQVQGIWSSEDKRRRQADHYMQDVLSGRYLPSVDVFVPTYSEPNHIVRRTVVGCQAMDYPNKTIYILDDKRRPHMRALAKELGCEYITQPEGFVNNHAKAGNLNNAWPRTNGDLIAVVDSDFVPFKHFLTRVVGFFQQPDLAIVQTPQDFYNPDHHVRNLGLSHLFPGDLAIFFQFDQSTRDTFGAAVCCGTSYVIRRAALESVGGYYTRCVAEDSSTSTLLLGKGWQVAYLNETLTMGESTRNYRDFLKQRLRWLQGNLQIAYCSGDMKVWSRLNLIQRSYMLSFFMGSFGPLIRAVFLTFPLLGLYLGVSPYVSSINEFLYYNLPYVLAIMGTVSWASNNHSSFIYSEIYETILCFPGLQRLISTLRSPFGRGFQVTPKGVTEETKTFNLQYTWPLAALIVLTVIMLGLQFVGHRMGFWQTLASPDFTLVACWMVYNLVLLSVALLAAIDQPERRGSDRFPLQTPCELTVDGQSYWGHTSNVSETGASVMLITEHSIPAGRPVSVRFLKEGFCVEGNVVWSGVNQYLQQVSVEFGALTEQQSRRLVEVLYCDVTWWKRSKRLGVLDSLLAFVASVLKLRPILSVYRPSASSRS